MTGKQTISGKNPIPQTHNTLKAISMGIDTYRENIVFMAHDCHICKSEGFTALTRIVIDYGDRSIIATLNVVYSDIIKPHQLGLSMEAMKRLSVKEGDNVSVRHLGPIDSLGKVRAKMYGKKLSDNDFREIIGDISSGKYSNIELAAFLSSCSGNRMTTDEITGLTKAMIATGEKIRWDNGPVFDKHCVGGLPGNRTTPIVVSIAAAAGLMIPKTSSRAITSPAGTADTMEVMAPVNLSISEIRRVVREEGGCICWGGIIKLSPADDVLISVERSLDMDSEGQMIASVLSKKIAAGSTHVVIDIPVGKTAKVRSQEQAIKLKRRFKAVAKAIGISVKILLTDGTQPVGRGIGPSLEAMDILAILRNEPHAPQDLKLRAVRIAGALLELSGKCRKGVGPTAALGLLDTGIAYSKFLAICNAQGGFREPSFAPYRYQVLAKQTGTVKEVDNRKLARIAKLAGAPDSHTAGILYTSPLGKKIAEGDVLYTVYAESEGELEYVKEYLNTVDNPVNIVR